MVGLKLKPKKCQFLKTKVKYLSHMVCGEGICPVPGKVETVKNILMFPDFREVGGFPSLIGYHRCHVDQFSKLTKSLTTLRLKNGKFGYTKNE